VRTLAVLPSSVRRTHNNQAARFAIFAMVARLQPVAACMLLQDWPAVIMRLMPSLRYVLGAALVEARRLRLHDPLRLSFMIDIRAGGHR